MSERAPVLVVTFRSYGRSRRVWVEKFDLGDATANGLLALERAHKMNAAILDSREE